MSRLGPRWPLRPALGPRRGLRQGKKARLGHGDREEAAEAISVTSKLLGGTARAVAEDGDAGAIVGSDRAAGPEGRAGRARLRGRGGGREAPVAVPAPPMAASLSLRSGGERRGAWRVGPQRLLAAPLAGHQFRLTPRESVNSGPPGRQRPPVEGGDSASAPRTAEPQRLAPTSAWGLHVCRALRGEAAWGPASVPRAGRRQA